MRASLRLVEIVGVVGVVGIIVSGCSSDLPLTPTDNDVSGARQEGSGLLEPPPQIDIPIPGMEGGEGDK